MKKGDYLSAILRSKRTVFSTKDLALLWHEPNLNATSVRLNYYVHQGDLIRIRYGLYAKDKNYDRLELATRIMTPAYVSFETVLVKEGVIFQYYETIFVATYEKRECVIDNQVYQFRRLKKNVLTNTAGVMHVQETAIASRERAMLDTIYVNPNFYFDNTNSVDWNLVHNLLPVYANKRMDKRIAELMREE